MKSIRKELAFKIGGGTLAILLLGGAGLYLSLRGALVSQFDNVLSAKADALILASELDEEELEIDIDVLSFAGFGSGARGDYFIVFDAMGSEQVRSPSLGVEELSMPRAFLNRDKGVGRIRLPEGVSGRSFWTTYELEGEEEGDINREMKILVASSDAVLRRTLRTMGLFIGLFGATGLLLILAISGSVVASGLRPLEKMSDEVEGIDISRLAKRLSREGIPQELGGVAAKINELLERLEESFGREKRFTSNAAHELRTPLAELRTMTELGTRWPDEFTEEQGNEMLEVISNLETLLGTLSLLAKAESETTPMKGPIEIGEFVGEQIDRLSAEMKNRGLEVETVIEAGAFQSDPVLFRAILQNLLGNAVDYAPTGSVIRMHAGPSLLSVENEAPELMAEDLENLFSRFWRKSKSRSERGHSGLGLSVVRASVEHLGGTCRSSLEKGRLRVEVEWAKRDSSSKVTSGMGESQA
ncbi:MAG: ATP-binding protein [Verrucomicrobiota bacterium]